MTDWIEHTTDTCPVDPETVVEVRYRGAPIVRRGARFMGWHRGSITHYRIITPAKPPEPEMTKPEPDLITLRLECLKLVTAACPATSRPEDLRDRADFLLHYVLNGSVDKAP